MHSIILSLSICYFVTVLRNVLSIRPPHPLDSLLLLCVWEQRAGSTLLSARPILTQAASPGSVTKYVKLQQQGDRWYSNTFSVSCPDIDCVTFQDLHTFSVQNKNIKSDTVWPLWRRINDEHGRRQMSSFSFWCYGFEIKENYRQDSSCGLNSLLKPPFDKNQTKINITHWYTHTHSFK